MGRIGQAVARRAKAFGLRSTTTTAARRPDRSRKELEATYWESLDQMLARMDIVSVNCPHTPATYHLLSARRLKLLKPHAIIVNTARGEVIDENALARMLEAGEIAGAGLDVFEHEPAVNPKLLALDNVVLLPHMGSATIEGRIDMGEKVIINIKTFIDGHRRRTACCPRCTQWRAPEGYTIARPIAEVERINVMPFKLWASAGIMAAAFPTGVRARSVKIPSAETALASRRAARPTPTPWAIANSTRTIPPYAPRIRS
jgi:hypothetical protein